MTGQHVGHVSICGNKGIYSDGQWDYLDHFRTDFALNYLEKVDTEKPFFLFMSYRSPHAHEFKVRHNELYADSGWPEIERTHAARITMLDRQIERLYDRLKEMGELENTVIFFTSDNGRLFTKLIHSD